MEEETSGKSSSSRAAMPIIEADASTSRYIIEGTEALPGGTARSRVMIVGSHSGSFEASIE